MTEAETAKVLMSLGYDIIPVGVQEGDEFNVKNPGIVAAWQTKEWTYATLAKCLKEDTRRGIGIRLALDGVIDIESDTESADAAAGRLFKDWHGKTVAWRSVGGKGHFAGVHRLFRLTEAQIARLTALEKTVKFVSPEGIEVRLRGQSVLPPTGGRQWTLTDFRPKSKTKIKAADLPTLPDDIFSALTAGLEPPKTADAGEGMSDSPGSDFCVRGDWAAILEPHGWKVNGPYVTRPGKTHGVSGSLDYCTSATRGQLLWIFSSAPEIAPLETEVSYSKFEAYAILNHDGNFSEAAKQLKREGYGTGKGANVEDLFDVFPDEEPRPAPPAAEPEFSPEPAAKHKSVEFARLDDKFYNNLIGRYCLELRKFSNIDTQAVYYQALEMFGILCGRNVWYTYNMNRRYIADYLILSGETGAGKGTTFDLAKALFKPKNGDDMFAQLTHTEQAYVALNFGRFGSAEGLVTELAARKPDFDSNGLILGDQYWGSLFITDQEASAAFVKMFYEGSTINENLRQAWDSNTISNRTKASKLVAPSPLIGLVWHITPSDLDALPNSLLQTGFVNRIKLLNCQKPDESPQVDPGVDIEFYKAELNKIIGAIATDERSEITFTPEAKKFLRSIAQKQHQWEGDVGKTHERYTAHVERSACRLALLNGSRIVGVDEAIAAEAMQEVVFNHTEKMIGGMRGANKFAIFKQMLLEYIREAPNAVSLYEITKNMCHNNAETFSKRDRALEELVNERLLERGMRGSKGKPGRPAVIYRAL